MMPIITVKFACTYCTVLKILSSPFCLFSVFFFAFRGLTEGTKRDDPTPIKNHNPFIHRHLCLRKNIPKLVVRTASGQATGKVIGRFLGRFRGSPAGYRGAEGSLRGNGVHSHRSHTSSHNSGRQQRGSSETSGAQSEGPPWQLEVPAMPRHQQPGRHKTAGADRLAVCDHAGASAAPKRSLNAPPAPAPSPRRCCGSLAMRAARESDEWLATRSTGRTWPR